MSNLIVIPPPVVQTCTENCGKLPLWLGVAMVVMVLLCAIALLLLVIMLFIETVRAWKKKE